MMDSDTIRTVSPEVAISVLNDNGISVTDSEAIAILEVMYVIAEVCFKIESSKS